MDKYNNMSTQFTDEAVDSDMFYHSLFSHNPDMVCFADKKGSITAVNDSFSTTLGFSKEKVTTFTLDYIFPKSETPRIKDLINLSLSGRVQKVTTSILDKNRTAKQVELSIIPARSKKATTGAFVVIKDITQYQLTKTELAESEAKFRNLVEEINTGVFIIQMDKLLYGNPVLYKIFNLDPSITRFNIKEYIHPDDRVEISALIQNLPIGEEVVHHSLRMMNENGAVIHVEIKAKKLLYHNHITTIGTITDITDRIKTAEKNRFLAYHDPLTKLPNRSFLNEKLEQEILISKALQKKFALMVFNLNRFKYVNDTLGHTIADNLLQEYAKQLNNYFGDHAFIARVGPDEFAVLLSNNVVTEEVIAFAKEHIKLLDEPSYIDSYELFISTSIGISFYPTDGEDIETLYKHVNSALYKAKAKGHSAYQIFTSSMDVETYKTFTLESELRKALKLNQFELFYQPKINPKDNQIIGAEALIRWNHPEWGMVYPNEFIPLAEEIGLIIEIGKWVIETACNQNKAWLDQGLPAIPISINFSAHRFLEKDMLVNIKEILNKTQLAPEYFEVEILETFLLENENKFLTTLDELKKLGIRIALDDFGIGYSSLSYLNKFKGRVDTLKIDRSFINDLSNTNPDSSNFITKTIIELAHHLNMDVVAEGVDNIEKLEILKQFGCNVVQGYLYSEPLPADQFVILLQKGKIKTKVSDKEKEIQNRRNFFRVNLDFPLSATMTLTRIHGRNVELGKTEVLIEDIGIGGLRFLSNIRLAVHKDFILEFQTEILSNLITFQGNVVWMNEIKDGVYEYGVEFLLDESEIGIITPLLNKLAIMLRKNPIPSGCSFIKEDKYHFFKSKKKVVK
ncbi:EAL domain-containing protein [Ornithinibacillus californiensis]|uniref:EAL domain-containing protein n=1 Tax=Ornithinibacillus californiensis TaxID=161536 RepID=UPI00069D8C16|nr:EAL domain-containing protein [Ornithinibacillus californiensis]